MTIDHNLINKQLIIYINISIMGNCSSQVETQQHEIDLYIASKNSKYLIIISTRVSQRESKSEVKDQNTR